MESTSALVGGIVTGGMTGFAARSLLGERSNPCRDKDGAFWYAGTITGAWWVLTYPAGRPFIGAHLVGFGLGYLIGQAAGVIVEIIRRGGPDNGGGGWGGGGGWDDEPPAPWGPGPTDYKPERAPSIVEGGSARLTTAHFAEECAANPAPAEPSPLIPAGR